MTAAHSALADFFASVETPACDTCGAAPPRANTNAWVVAQHSESRLSPSNWNGRNMQYTFTLHEDAWLGNGPVFARGPVIVYRVGGMPDGKTARIANFGAPNRNDWRIMRINGDNTQTDWTGHYESVDDALAALQQDRHEIRRREGVTQCEDDGLPRKRLGSAPRNHTFCEGGSCITPLPGFGSALMFKAFALVRNLESKGEGPGLAEFNRPRWSSIQELREVFICRCKPGRLDFREVLRTVTARSSRISSWQHSERHRRYFTSSSSLQGW